MTMPAPAPGPGKPEAGDPLVVGGREFRSRLLVGTGKYASNEVMVDAIRASGSGCVTVSVRASPAPNK